MSPCSGNGFRPQRRAASWDRIAMWPLEETNRTPKIYVRTLRWLPCAAGSGDPLRLEVIRTLARDLKEELEALAALAEVETGASRIEAVEGALRAADVANLAACVVPEL